MKVSTTKRIKKQVSPPKPPVKIRGGNGGQRCIMGNLIRAGKSFPCVGTLHVNPDWVSWEIDELGDFNMDITDLEGFNNGDFSEQERELLRVWTRTGYEWLRYGL